MIEVLRKEVVRWRVVRAHPLRVVNLRAFQRLEALDPIPRQLGEDPQEAPDVGIRGVPPELPILEWREEVGVEPYRARRRLAHLLALRCGEQRRREPVHLRAHHTSRELHPVDDVAPLVRAAKLEERAVTAVQLEEVVRLPRENRRDLD